MYDDACVKDLIFSKLLLVVANLCKTCDIVQINLYARFSLIY